MSFAQNPHSTNVVASGDTWRRTTHASSCPFDVILADVVMGDIGGVQPAETLREVYPTVPVILMTGRDSLVDGVIDAGEMPLFKPFGALQLMRVINDALSRHD